METFSFLENKTHILDQKKPRKKATFNIDNVSKNNIPIKTNLDLNGFLHNENDEPAIVYKDGTKVWYKHGFKHRLNGAAQIDSSGKKYHYIEGKYIKPEKFKKYSRLYKLKKAGF